ncbi:MAG: hypothetical protein WBQ69_02770 [Gallionella sp.]
MSISRNTAPVWSMLSVPGTLASLSLNPYVNFHRPCFFPETITDATGKERKRYRYEEMKTPYEKLKSLPNAREYLKPDITFELLDAEASKMSDNDAALALNDARRKLFPAISAASRKQA